MESFFPLFQDRLQQIDVQQREMLNNVKHDMESLEKRRLHLVDEFRKVKGDNPCL